MAKTVQHLHTVATEIVTEAVEDECDVIVCEDLTDIDIRDRLHCHRQSGITFGRFVAWVSL
jgi:hypothetical protein